MRTGTGLGPLSSPWPVGSFPKPVRLGVFLPSFGR